VCQFRRSRHDQQGRQSDGYATNHDENPLAIVCSRDG
jgi:hypothetical protein